METYTEQSRGALQAQKHELQEKMKKANKAHRCALLLYHYAIHQLNFARRGLNPFGDGLIRGIIALAVRLFLIVILVAIKQDLLFVAGGYVVIHLVALILGKILFKMAEKKLIEVHMEADQISDEYMENGSMRYDIVGDSVFYDDGTLVSGNQITVGTALECCDIAIYRREVNEEDSIFFSRSIDSNDPGVSLNKLLSSIPLDRKFGIIVERGREWEAMKFFTPSRQLKMLNTPEMGDLGQITISEGMFTAVTGKPVPYPAPIDPMKWRSLEEHLKDIEKYCSSVRKQADRAHESLRKISFLYE